MNFQISEITRPLGHAISTGNAVTIRSYAPSEHLEQNEICIFIKPELTGLASIDSILTLLFEHLDRFNVEVVAARAVGHGFLRRHKTMQHHYGTIDRISRCGAAAVSDEARHRLTALAAQYHVRTAMVFGAHQFLAAYSSFSSESLSILYDNLQNNKLAAGTHCVVLSLRGTPAILLNGFHPEQLDHYERASQSVMVFACRTTTPWRTLRTEMTGATNPATAISGSLRSELLRLRTRLGIPEITTGRNGIHVSAGPLEGMAEIARFLADDSAPPVTAESLVHKLTFGRLLAKVGISRASVAALANNPCIALPPRAMPAFDATEELDAPDAAALLAQALEVAE